MLVDGSPGNGGCSDVALYVGELFAADGAVGSGVDEVVLAAVGEAVDGAAFVVVDGGAADDDEDVEDAGDEDDGDAAGLDVTSFGIVDAAPDPSLSDDEHPVSAPNVTATVMPAIR